MQSAQNTAFHSHLKESKVGAKLATDEKEIFTTAGYGGFLTFSLHAISIETCNNLERDIAVVSRQKNRFHCDARFKIRLFLSQKLHGCIFWQMIMLLQGFAIFFS